MWGNSFPIVFSTRDDYSDSSLLRQRIVSLPILTSPAFISRSCKNFTRWREGSSLPDLGISRQVLRENHDESIVELETNETATNKPKQHTNILIRHPLLSLTPCSQRGALEPFTVHTLQLNFYSTHYNIHNSLPRPTKENRFNVRINRLLLEFFCRLLNPNCEPGDNDGPTSAANVAGAQYGASRKRKASSALARKPRERKLNKNNGGGGDGDGDNNKNPPDPRNNRHTNAPAEPEEERFFACHFFKLNPRAYHRCGSKQLTSADTLKQHMNRAHRLRGVVPCHVCWEGFPDTVEGHQTLREHLTSAHCREVQGPDTLYDEDLHLLETRRGASDEEKWYQIWDQLCPDHPRPHSPYIERNGIDEFGELFRRDYQSRTLRVLSSMYTLFPDIDPQRMSDFIHALNAQVNQTFTQQTLFDSRFRRSFQPAITAPPETGTHQPEAPPQSPGDLFPPNPYDPGLEDNHQQVDAAPQFPDYDDPAIFDNIYWNNI